MIKKTDLAYLAGVVDGEGTISFKARRDIKKPWSFDVRFRIANTDKRWLVYLRTLLEGRGYIGKTGKPTSSRGKQGWNLQLDSRDALWIIGQLLPFLKIKKKRAQLALQYKAYSLGKGSRRLTPRERQIRTRQFFKMKELNIRGECK